MSRAEHATRQALHRGVDAELSSFVLKFYLSCTEMDSSITLAIPRIVLEVSGVTKDVKK